MHDHEYHINLTIQNRHETLDIAHVIEKLICLLDQPEGTIELTSQTGIKK